MSHVSQEAEFQGSGFKVQRLASSLSQSNRRSVVAVADQSRISRSSYTKGTAANTWQSKEFCCCLNDRSWQEWQRGLLLGVS